MTAPDAAVMTTGPPRILNLIFLEFEQADFVFVPMSGGSPLSAVEDCDQSIGAASMAASGTIARVANRKRAEFRLRSRMRTLIFNIRDAENQKQSPGCNERDSPMKDFTAKDAKYAKEKRENKRKSPQGTPENSPPFQRRIAKDRRFESPQGTNEKQRHFNAAPSAN